MMNKFFIVYYCGKIGIKSNGIYIYCFNVSLFFLFIFFPYVMDCTAFEISAYLFEVVYFVAFLHFFQNARHHLGLWTCPQYLHLLLADVFTGVPCFVSICLSLSICHVAPKFFNSCKLLMTASWVVCTSTLFARINTHSHSIIIFSSLLVRSLMVSVSIPESFSQCMNYTFNCLSTSL